MIHFFSDTKVYVFAPAGIVTGGSELLHQFVDYLNNNGKEAYIVYYGSAEHKIADDYKKYNIRQTENFEDSPHNIAVLFEGNFIRVRTIRKAQIMLWWLSVDLMYKSSASYLSLLDIFAFSPTLAFKTVYHRIISMIKRGENQFMNNLSIDELRSCNATNAYQAVYIQHYLYDHGFDNIIALSDYINSDFLNDQKNLSKEDIILYNPKKGFEYTEKIINANPDLKFIPIQNLTRKGVVELMGRAKLYIDFGFHPGKDRMPREAALSGCIVITSKSGSAYFFEDVAIPSQYKYHTTNANVSLISKQIHYALENYEEARKDMNYYIERIYKEKNIFFKEVNTIINL